jgi:hypothetical protein
MQTRTRGRYHGVCPDVEVLRREVRSVEQIAVALRRSGWRGLVLLDTKSDLDLPTKSSLEASDLAVVVVKEEASLHDASRVFGLLGGWGRPRSRTRVLLSSIQRQMRGLAEEVLEALTSLAAVGVARRAVPSEPRKRAARISAAEAPSALRRWILRGERAEHLR